MLTFLAPTALFGFALLAIPIIVHLLKPRKVRRTAFSSLRWLRATQQRLSRRIRWHQILLFLLRAAFIVLLVLAAAQPLFQRDGQVKPRERFVVLDVSRSMSYRGGDGVSSFERAKQHATAFLAQQRVHDRTALLATGTTTKLLAPLAHAGSNHLAALATLQPGLTETDLGSALELLRPLLRQCRPEADVEIDVITDNYQGAWRQNAIASLLDDAPENLRVVTIDVAEPAAQNGWISDCRRVSEVSAPDRVASQRALQVQVRCVGSACERTVRLSGLASLGDRAQSVAIEPGQATQVTFELPADLDVRGKAVEVMLEPADGLPSDDRWFIALDETASLRVLVVDGSGQSGDPVPPGFALRTAIDALSTSAATIDLKSKKFSELQPADFHEVDVVMLADVSELSASVLSELKERVRLGVGLAIFLGPGVDASFYNRHLLDPLNRQAGLLPLALDRIQEVPAARGGLAPWQGFQWQHPLLAGLFDPALGDLAQVQSRSYYRFVGDAATSNSASGGAVLGLIGDSPAIIEQAVGMGKVLIFNTTANDTWSDLPRHKSFVPLVDRLLNYLSGGSLRRTFETGQPGTLAVTQPESGETVSVISPSNQTWTPPLTTLGNRALLRLPVLAESGVYRVRHSQGSAAESTFVVQAGRGDSLLLPTNVDTLTSWWQPATFALERFASRSDRALSETNTASLASILAILAGLMLALEMFLVHWLCPRVNPPLAASLVQHAPEPHLTTAR